jgi:hypothetical protein
MGFQLEKNEIAQAKGVAQAANKLNVDDILEANKIHAFVQLLKAYETGDGKELLDSVRHWNNLYRDRLADINELLPMLNPEGTEEKKDRRDTMNSITKHVSCAQTYGRLRIESVDKFLDFAKTELDEWAKNNPDKPRPDQAGVSQEDIKTIKKFDLHYTFTLDSDEVVVAFWKEAMK